MVADTAGEYSHKTEPSESPNAGDPRVVSDHFLYPPVAKKLTDSRWRFTTMLNAYLMFLGSDAARGGGDSSFLTH